MRTAICRALLALSAAPLVAACMTPADDADLGTVSLNLVGASSGGTVYRLRDAIIDVTGPDYAVTWDTEDDPDRTSLSADVAIGDYEATLAEGWRLERLAPPAPPETVDATLLSDNPLEFAVAPGVRTRVPLRFRVEDGEVDLEQGYDIEIEIEDEDPPPSPPSVAITFGPSGPTNDPTPTFGFVTSGSPTTTCRLDAGAMAPCAGSFTAPALADGSHTFQVTAVNAGGTATATRVFTVDTTPPTVVITAGPPAYVYTTTATFAWSTSGAPTTVQCALFPVGGTPTFTACASPSVQTIPAFSGTSAAFRFQVRVLDAAGNLGQATRDFTAAVLQ